MQKDTIVRMLSNLQCRKMPKRTPIRLKNNFLTGNIKNIYFLKIHFFQKIFLVKMSHSAEKGALNSPNAFFSFTHRYVCLIYKAACCFSLNLFYPFDKRVHALIVSMFLAGKKPLKRTLALYDFENFLKNSCLFICSIVSFFSS